MAPTRSLVKMRIVEFYTKAREKTAGKLYLDSEGKPIYDDWVAYASIGSNDEVRAPIRDLRPTSRWAVPSTPSPSGCAPPSSD